MSESTIQSLLTWLPAFLFIGILIVAAKRSRKNWEPREQEIVDRQKEAVDLLKEIRDLLKNKGN